MARKRQSSAARQVARRGRCCGGSALTPLGVTWLRRRLWRPRLHRLERLRPPLASGITLVTSPRNYW